MGTGRAFGEVAAPNAPAPHTVPARRPGWFECPVRRGVAITCAAVAAGGWASTAVIAPVTPQDVATAYMEARFDRDWAAAWALTCDVIRDAIDYATFAEEAEKVHEYYFMPSGADIAIGDVELARRSAPEYVDAAEYVKVPAKATSDERLFPVAFDGDLALTLEDGEFRVCGPG